MKVPIRVVLWQADFPTWLPYMYSGVTMTLVRGFEAAEGVSALRSGVGVRRNASKAFRNSVSWLRKGDVFLWIGVNHGLAPWAELRRRGVRSVAYQTEPTHSCEGLHRAQVDELWDFSWHNIEACAGMKSAPASLRYVPLGALDSPRASAVASARPKLMFFGAPYHGQGRRHCFSDLKQRMRETLKYTYRVWDDGAFVNRVLSHFTIFLNLHKDCGDSHNPVTFRVAKLLNAEGLVLSERCHPRDEAEYAGMVLFVNDTASIVSTHTQLVQSGSWRARAQEAAARFQQRFQPRAIFERAGIYRSFGLSGADG